MTAAPDDREESPQDPAGPSDALGEDASLEERLARLERIMADLEADDVPLERALELFEEGVAHVRAAEKVLAESELRVEELLSGGGTRPFEEEAG